MQVKKQNEFLHPDYPKLSGKVLQAARLGQLQEFVPEGIVNEIVIDGETVEYPMIVRSEVDPPINNQEYGLVSFILADEPQKLSNGSIIYGYGKLRGNSADENLIRADATKIIRAVDSKYPSKIVHVGKWFPIVKGNAFTKETIDVPVDDERIKKEEVLKEAERKRKEEREYFDRRAKELTEGGDNTDDPESLKYFTTRRQTYMYLVNEEERQMKNLEDIRDKIKKAANDIIRLENSHPEYKEQWLETYNKERKAVGITEFVEDEKFRILLEKFRLE